MPLDLHKIQLDQASKDLLTTKNKFPELRQAFKAIAQDAIQAAADLGRDTAKSTVPWDTLQLRGAFNVGQIRQRIVGNTAKVYVVDSTHTGNGRPQPASNLAKVLDSGTNEKGKKMHRSQNSLALLGSSIRKGSETAGWIKDQDDLFRNEIQRYLHQRTNKSY